MKLGKAKFVLCGLLSSVAAFGQASAVLRGTVVDPGGGPVSGAVVRLENPRTGLERLTATDGAGRFELLNIPFESYRVTVEAEGFGPDSQTALLRTTVPVVVDVTLPIASLTQTIDVSVGAQADLLDTQTTGTRAELSRESLETMPLMVGARGLEAALLNFPGFAANANGAIHPRGAHNQMTYVIDGMPISDQFTGSFATSIDPSLVQTIELYTGDVPPEYGAKVSGVANITTRSGFDTGRKRFGQLELGTARFGTASAAGQAGGTAGKLGWFAALSALKSNRFLDTPSLDNLHNGGNAERLFTRFDYHASPKNIFRLSAMAGRSSFQLANLRSQHANGQQQRRGLKDAAFSLGYVRLLSPSTTFDSTTSFRTAIAQLFPSAGDTPVTSSLSRHLSTVATLNRLNVIRGRHTFRFGADYQYFPVSENFLFALTDPAFNHPDSPDFNHNLVAHDLTRGGDFFRFSGSGSGRLATLFAQDRIQLGDLLLNLGARLDRYDFLVGGGPLQPRLGAAYHVQKTGTVLRASYNRNYQTPPNENLLLANSPEASTLAPPEVRRDLNGGSLSIRPQEQNVYEVGLEQRLGSIARVTGAFFHKNSINLQDNDNFLNTGVIFPTSLAQSNVNGVEARVSVPEWRRWTGSFSATHYRVIVTPPFTGGLFLGSSALDVLSDGPFVIDHDQPLALSALATYRARAGWWTSLQARHDSGLVSNPSDPAEVAADPDFFDQLPYVDLNREVPRVRPRTIVDAAFGYEHRNNDLRVWEIVAQISNLTNKTALYNFQSVFVGTRVVQPRTAALKLRWYW